MEDGWKIMKKEKMGRGKKNEGKEKQFEWGKVNCEKITEGNGKIDWKKKNKENGVKEK